MSDKIDITKLQERMDALVEELEELDMNPYMEELYCKEIDKIKNAFYEIIFYLNQYSDSVA